VETDSVDEEFLTDTDRMDGVVSTTTHIQSTMDTESSQETTAVTFQVCHNSDEDRMHMPENKETTGNEFVRSNYLAEASQATVPLPSATLEAVQAIPSAPLASVDTYTSQDYKVDVQVGSGNPAGEHQHRIDRKVIGPIDARFLIEGFRWVFPRK
jgi:hypothetical protein